MTTTTHTNEKMKENIKDLRNRIEGLNYDGLNDTKFMSRLFYILGSFFEDYE